MTITAAHHNSYSLPGILLHVVVGAPTWRECHGYRTATAMAGRLLHVDTASGFLPGTIADRKQVRPPSGNLVVDFAYELRTKPLAVPYSGFRNRVRQKQKNCNEKVQDTRPSSGALCLVRKSSGSRCQC